MTVRNAWCNDKDISFMGFYKYINDSIFSYLKDVSLQRRHRYVFVFVIIYLCHIIAASKPAQRVFKINMLFPSSVLCNSAGQGVLRQKVRNAVNALNRDWNFCSYSVEGLF